MIDARKCNEIRSLMADWLDGELSPALRSRVDEHLAACDSCRAAFDQMRAMGGDLTSLGRAADRIAEDAARSARPSLTWRRSWVRAAAVALLIVSGFYLLTPWRSPRVHDARIVRNSIEKDGSSKESAERAAILPEGDCRADGYTAVAVASSNPRVRIVWLYEDARSSVGSTNSSGGPLPRPQG